MATSSYVQIAFQLLRKLSQIMAPHFSNTSGKHSHSSCLLAAAVFSAPLSLLYKTQASPFLKQHKLFTVEGVSSLYVPHSCVVRAPRH